MAIRVSSAGEDKRTDIISTLRRYRSMVADYQACCELYDMLYPSGTQTLTDMPKTQSDTYEPERWAQRRWSHRERMDKSLDEMRDAIGEVEGMVDLLDGDYRTVLVRRYLMNESYESIGTKLNYCKRQVIRKHNHAIDKLVRRVIHG